MKTRLFVSFFLLYLLPHTLDAQGVPDSAARPDSASSTRQSMAIREIESPPLWVGARLSDMLTARTAALRVSPARGALGSPGRFRVRGAQTIADDRMPLVILDGMRLSAASGTLGGAARLEDLNPEEIASIEVIPGAASAALYGPGAANGVIVVRTREGREGRPRWEIYSEAGTRRPFGVWPAWYGGIDADNADSTYRTGRCALPAVGQGLCVQDSIFRYNPYGYTGQLRTAIARQHGVAVSGGLPWLDYFVAGELDGDGGAYALSSDEVSRLTGLGQPPRDRTRYPEREGGSHLRTNLRLRPLSALVVQLRGARITGDGRLPPVNPNLRYDPFRGDWFQLETTQTLNRRLGGADVEWSPLGRLSLHGVIGYDRVRRSDKFLQRWGEGPRTSGTPPLGSISDGRTAIDTRTAGLSAAYEFGSPERVAFRTIVGYEHNRFERDSSLLRALLDSGATALDTTGGLWSGYWESWEGSSRALYVQQQVSFRERFDITAGLRRDKFKYFSKAAVHPSVAVSWVARAGRTGAVGSIRARAAYGSAGRGPNALEHERTREWTAGLTSAFLAERVQVAITLYDLRSDVLQFVPSIPSGGPPLLGYAPGAEITNRGIEIVVSGHVVERPGAALGMTLVAWGNRNRLAALPGPPVFGSRGGYVVGYPVGGYWSQPPAGFSDVNNDGIIALSELTPGAAGSRVWAGTPYPTQGAALTADLTLRGGVRLGATLDYQAGHTLFNEVEWTACASWQCRALVDPATPLAQQANALAALGGSTPPGFFEDADFLKLREIWMSVEVPRRIVDALRARSATLAFVGRNLHTWTRYSGIDPEPTADEPLLGGPELIADRLVMPRLPEWTLRVRLTY